MLARVCIKRFRFTLYAFLFFLLMLHLSEKTGSGAISAVCILIALPLTLIAFFWGIYAAIRDVIRYLNNGEVPEDTPTLAELAVWWVLDEIDEVSSLDGHGKARFFLFRIGGAALAVGGLVLIIRDSITVGTIMLIAGLALWMSASPQSVNRNNTDMKLLACPENTTVAGIQAAFADMDTPLGRPYLGAIRTISGDAALWGPNAEGEYIYLYQTRNKRYIRLCSNNIPDWITSEHPAAPAETDGAPLDMPNLLADICDLVEAYLKTGTVGTLPQNSAEP